MKDGITMKRNLKLFDGASSLLVFFGVTIKEICFLSSGPSGDMALTEHGEMETFNLWSL